MRRLERLLRTGAPAVVAAMVAVLFGTSACGHEAKITAAPVPVASAEPPLDPVPEKIRR